MAWYKMRREGSGGGVTPIGDATDGDVLSGKTYMNANGASTGTMTNNGAVSQTLDITTTSYTVPEGYHNGSGTVSITTETKTITAGTSASTTSATSGKVISSVTVNPTPSQTKSASSSTSAQTITPDSGKLLSSVSIAAISPQRGAGTGITLTGIDNDNQAWAYFPYGWYPYVNEYGCYCYMNQAQAQAAHPHTGNTSLTTRADWIDLGYTHNTRWVHTSGVPNTNSGTYTFPANDTGGTKDLGEANTYRYVNATNVYNKGKQDGASGKTASFTSSVANQWIDVNVGFNPSIVILILNYAGQGNNYAMIIYDKYINSSKFIAAPWNYGASWGDLTTGVGGTYFMFKLINNGFSFVASIAGTQSYTYTAIP